MEGEYPVYLGERPVGHVTVTRQGLYRQFSCRCRLPGKGMCRLLAQWQDAQLDLGVLVPVEEEFGLVTRVAAKKCGSGIPAVSVIAAMETETDGFYPLCPEEPFAYLSRLENAFFERRYGQAGLVFRD